MPILSQRSGQDDRALLYPPELLPHFDDAFITSFDLFEEYIARQALAIFRSTGLEVACSRETGVAEAIAHAGLSAEIARVPVTWILDMVASRGWISRTNDGEARYHVERPPPELDPTESRNRQEQQDATCLPSYDIAALAAAQYPAVLRGELSGEQALFGGEGIVPWVKYFSNDNPIYAVSNTVGAIAAAMALPPGPARILEIGAGLGSGAEALLQQLGNRSVPVETYHLTDVSPLFLKRAQRNVSRRHPQVPLSLGQLDIDRPFAGQGLEGNTYSIAYGVNVLHVARDLAATLRELRNILQRDGVLVMAECVRPFEGRAIHLELVFNLLSSFRNAVLVPGWRPNAGFLTPEQWCAALEANGFAGARVFPDIPAIRDDYPSFICAALVARRA
ncbi:MAG TPA: class I SAM-dependent methyltransferase [Burkholderiales bacterium]